VNPYDEVVPYSTRLSEGSSVTHTIVAVVSVLDTTVGTEVICGAVVSAVPAVKKVPCPLRVGPFPEPSVDPTLK
jgi:hypothetical protein